MLEVVQKKIQSALNSTITFDEYFQFYIMKMQDFNIELEAKDLAKRNNPYVSIYGKSKTKRGRKRRSSNV